jgi:hypothetical protein
MEPFIYVSPT